MTNKLLILIKQYNDYKPLNGENIFLFKIGRILNGFRRKIYKFFESRQPLYPIEKSEISLENQMNLTGGGKTIYNR